MPKTSLSVSEEVVAERVKELTANTNNVLLCLEDYRFSLLISALVLFCTSPIFAVEICVQ